MAFGPGSKVEYDPSKESLVDVAQRIRDAVHGEKPLIDPTGPHGPRHAIATIPGELKDSGSRQSFVSGAVRDAQADKGAFSLLPGWGLFLVAWIYELGARKYASRNWEKGMPISRYIDSAQRHLWKYMMGFRDEPHLPMAGWNILGAIHTAVLVHKGVYSSEFNDLPNHSGVSYLGMKDGWSAPPLSPMEEKVLW